MQTLLFSHSALFEKLTFKKNMHESPESPFFSEKALFVFLNILTLKRKKRSVHERKGRSGNEGEAILMPIRKRLFPHKIQSSRRLRRGLTHYLTRIPAGVLFFRAVSRYFFSKKNVKKVKKTQKKASHTIDTFLREVYILYHRRNTAARFFDRSGKEITD